MGKSTPADMTMAFSELTKWGMPHKEDDLQGLYRLTERSLKEVKDLTEYEDSKAQRILTAVAFLAALAGSVFTVASRVISDAHILSDTFSLSSPVSWPAVVIYGGFGLYATLLLCGAALVLSAVRPKFNIPSDWSPKAGAESPSSYLFFKQILAVTPEDWVRSYVGLSVGELTHRYIKNSVIETYLVADKVRIKLYPLESGVQILAWSQIVLGVWLPFAIAIIAVPRILV